MALDYGFCLHLSVTQALKTSTRLDPRKVLAFPCFEEVGGCPSQDPPQSSRPVLQAVFISPKRWPSRSGAGDREERKRENQCHRAIHLRVLAHLQWDGLPSHLPAARQKAGAACVAPPNGPGSPRRGVRPRVRSGGRTQRGSEPGCGRIHLPARGRGGWQGTGAEARL